MMGILSSVVKMNDLVILEENSQTSKFTKGKSSYGSKIKVSKSSSISSEIKLLGMTSDEALAALDKYLDDAYISHLSSVRIVHGKGTGALRKAVHQYLKRSKYISEFHLAEYGEGDAGVTIAKFK